MRPLVEENGMIVEHVPPKNGNTNETAEHGDPQPTTFPSQPLGTWWAPMWKTPVTSTWPRWRERLGLGWWGIYGEPPKSMGTTKFVIYYLCYTYNVVFCLDWVKGCRGDIPLENLDFGIIAPPVGTPWYIHIYCISFGDFCCIPHASRFSWHVLFRVTWQSCLGDRHWSNVSMWQQMGQQDL